MKNNKGGGGNGRNNYKNSKKQNKNPTRGPPGILIFCEVGREKKCISEGMEILNHYYNDSNSNNGNDMEDKDTKINNKNNGDDGDKKMTLEEEIQMMKKETKKAPFHIYETGCRGSVFFMCSTKHCNVIVPQRQRQNQNQNQNEEQKSQTDMDGNKDKVETSQEQTSEQTIDESQNDLKRKSENIEDTPGTSSTSSSYNEKKQKTQDDDNGTITTTATTAKQNMWDPIQTIQSIVHDIQTSDSSAPRSRFITKMIPIQASCYANVEEITATAKALIEKFLMPHGIQFANNNDGASKVKSTSNTGTDTNSSSTCSEKNDNDSDTATATKKVTLPSFKIEFRKRFCSHLKREEVIDIVADTVQNLTNEYWNRTESKKQVDAVAEKKNPPLFNVNLTNPDYTVIIEICKTLCTMSVVKDAQSYHNFNLMKLQGIEVQ